MCQLPFFLVFAYRLVVVVVIHWWRLNCSSWSNCIKESRCNRILVPMFQWRKQEQKEATQERIVVILLCISCMTFIVIQWTSYKSCSDCKMTSYTMTWLLQIVDVVCYLVGCSTRKVTAFHHANGRDKILICCKRKSLNGTQNQSIMAIHDKRRTLMRTTAMTVRQWQRF